MVSVTKFDFSFHLKDVQNKVNEIIGLLCKLQISLHRTSLITIFKAFIRLHLDYLFHQNIEPIQYNSPLAITNAIRATSREKPS